ncbi:hypothetical protein [Streptococcus gallolyticus]|uniref:Uncharacterized protein n=1 Tax=Streptococcus gallolyticus TaxID=315405 RepID=A0A139R2V6_9STRE|nr:hypothetical protein [Streptococcus gallolyticus]KXT64439.1 hypothetical protein SGADD02_02069 [Streptococcus gallolyticus]KXU09170.1 hypothetical protein SGADD03_00993 [Streptococcus gallolyticus]
MAINRVYLDPTEVLGSDVYVSGFEEFQGTQYVDPYYTYEIDSPKERSAFLIVDKANMRNAPKIKTLSKVKSISGFSIEFRRFSHGGKTYNERVFVADGFDVEKVID